MSYYPSQEQILSFLTAVSAARKETSVDACRSTLREALSRFPGREVCLPDVPALTGGYVRVVLRDEVTLLPPAEYWRVRASSLAAAREERERTAAARRQAATAAKKPPSGPRDPGKTAREKALGKSARHERNRLARAAENRANARGGTGKKGKKAS